MGRPITVVVGGLATADPNGVSEAQLAAGAQFLVINGALAAGTFDADSVCASQSPGAAGNMTINGALASGGVATIATPRRIYVTSAGNDSGLTFTITGTTYTAGGGPVGVVETVTGANTGTVMTDNFFYAVTQVAISGASAAGVTVGHSGLATMDKARRVAIDSDGNDSGITFTITGTDWAGNPITEVLTGANAGVATSVLSYKTVIGVETSAAVATTVEVGSSAVADSPWVMLDPYAANAQVAIQVTVSGTVNFDVEQTLDNPTSLGNLTIYKRPDLVTWLNHPDSALANATATAQGNYAYAPAMAKVVLNSGTGTATATFIQAYLQ